METAQFAIAPIDARNLDDVVSIHCAAFPQQRHVMLGRDYVRAFINWFAHAEFGIALVAIDSPGRVLGYVVGAPIGYRTRLMRKVWRSALLGVVTRPRLAFSHSLWKTTFQRLKRAKSRRIAAGLLTPPVMHLSVIGVTDAARRHGVGFRLIQAFEHRARDAGAKSLQLSVNRSNSGAIRFYERAGWRLASGPDDDAFTYVKSL